jgi:hypothetical protein
MIYEYQILVTNNSINRAVMIGVSTSDLDQASALSDMSLSHITETLGELNTVIAGQLDYLDWGTELFYVSSNATISRYGDFDKVERYEVPTSGLRDFLIELKKFKEQCRAGDYYETIIGQAFTAINANPLQYKRWPTSDIYYLITLNNITVTLVLEPNDFNLTESQYVAQLKSEF